MARIIELPSKIANELHQLIGFEIKAGGSKQLNLPDRTPALLPIRKSGVTPLAFVHNPKAAGSSFLHFLRGHYLIPEEECPAYAPETLKCVNVNQYLLFAGHISIREYRLHLKYNTRYVTMFRDPTEMAISYYNYLMRWREQNKEQDYLEHYLHKASKRGMNKNYLEQEITRLRRGFAEIAEVARFGFDRLLDFYSREAISNYCLVQGTEAPDEVIKRFFFFGLQSSLDESLDLLAWRMAWPAPRKIPQANITPQNNDNLTVANMSASHRKRLATICQPSEKIWRLAQALFDQEFCRVFSGLDKFQRKDRIDARYFESVEEEFPLCNQFILDTSLSQPVLGMYRTDGAWLCNSEFRPRIFLKPMAGNYVIIVDSSPEIRLKIDGALINRVATEYLGSRVRSWWWISINDLKTGTDGMIVLAFDTDANVFIESLQFVRLNRCV